jgi:hypothetical protein
MALSEKVMDYKSKAAESGDEDVNTAPSCVLAEHTEAYGEPAKEEAETEEVAALDVPYSDSEYPPEVIKRWKEQADIMIEKFKRGEIKPMTFREAAAERGIYL